MQPKRRRQRALTAPETTPDRYQAIDRVGANGPFGGRISTQEADQILRIQSKLTANADHQVTLDRLLVLRQKKDETFGRLERENLVIRATQKNKEARKKQEKLSEAATAELRKKKGEAKKTIQTLSSESVKTATRTESEAHHKLLRVKGEKKYAFGDGVEMAAHWADGKIIAPPWKKAKAHLVEKILAKDDIQGSIRQLFEQERKYTQDPEDIYESNIVHGVESFTSLKGKGGWIGQAFNRIPILQIADEVAILTTKLASPDSRDSKIGSLKHTIALAGPQGLASLLVTPPGAFVGTLLGVNPLTGIPLAVLGAGSFLYSQVYTPSKMEAAFDRLDRQVRMGVFTGLDTLFTTPTDNPVLEAKRRVHADAFIRQYTTRTSKEKKGKKNDTFDNALALVTRLNSIDPLEGAAKGFTADAARAAARKLRVRMGVEKEEPKQETPQTAKQRAATEGEKLMEAVRAAFADKGMAQQKWGEQIRVLAPQMIDWATRNGQHDKVELWAQAQAQAVHLEALYTKAQSVIPQSA